MNSFFNSKDLAAMQAFVAALLFLCIPLFNILGIGSHKLSAVLHGLGACFTVIFSTRAAHLIFPLIRGKEGSDRKLELYLWMTNVCVLLTIVFGNWLYTAYRAPDGPQQWLLYNRPLIHMVVMEFKEFVSLFPLPLGVTAVWILRRFRRELKYQQEIISIIALLVTLTWLCVLAGFIFGLGLAKLKMP